MVDNFDLILRQGFINFGEGNEMFMHLEILQRKKDIPDLSRNSKKIRDYYITSREKLEALRPYIIRMCEEEKARAYLCIQAKDQCEVMRLLNYVVAQRVYEKNFQKPWNIFSSVVDKTRSRNARWVLDVDIPGQEEEVTKYLLDIGISSFSINVIPTKNGVHIITPKFNRVEFATLFPDVEIKEDGLTVLYIPKSLD